MKSHFYFNKISNLIINELKYRDENKLYFKGDGTYHPLLLLKSRELEEDLTALNSVDINTYLIIEKKYGRFVDPNYTYEYIDRDKDTDITNKKIVLMPEVLSKKSEEVSNSPKEIIKHQIDFNNLRSHDTVIITLKDGRVFRGWRPHPQFDNPNIIYWGDGRQYIKGKFNGDLLFHAKIDEILKIESLKTKGEAETEENRTTLILIIFFIFFALFMAIISKL